MHALRHAGDRRGTVKAARDKVHLRVQGISKIKAANSKAAKSCLGLSFHPVVRMEFLCVVAHLLHPLKARVALSAQVELLFVRHLLVLHQFLDLAKFAPARLALVFLEHAVTPCLSACPSTPCTGSPECARPALGGNRTYPACPGR